MSDFLYFLFVFPLEQLLTFFCQGIFAFTKNEAAAIVILSLLVNLFLLKIFSLTDNRAALETKRKKDLDALTNSWKGVYNRAKTFAFTQTLYRQNHYHPIFALSALGGLAIQIPFFYAMYFVIKNGNALPSAEFVTITAIDSALGIHVLPILMTAITLANVFLSSTEKSARFQGTIIAILFLVLLYEMPHALVLYWTTNMAFSLARAVWAKFQKPKITAPKVEISKIPKPLPDLSKILKIAKIAVSALALAALGAFFWAITQNYNNVDVLNQVGLFLQFLSAIFVLYFLFLVWHKIRLKNFKDSKKIFNLSILNITFLICVFSPYTLYQSDILQFHPSFTLATLCALFGAFLLFSFLIIYAVNFLPQKTQWVFAFLVSAILVLGILNSFIFTGNYGSMDRFVFQEKTFSSPESRLWQSLLFCATVLFSTGFAYFLFFYLKRIGQIIFLTLLIVSALHTANIVNARWQIEKTFQKYGTQNSAAPYGDELFSYSKNQKNIVVIVLDMFAGSHFPFLLDYFPQFKTQLDGFTYFKNATTSSNATEYVMPSIIGGEYYTIANQNLRGDNHDEAEIAAYYNTANAFTRAGFDVSFILYPNAASQKMQETPGVFWLDDTRLLRNYFLQNFAQTTFKDSYIFDIARFLAFGLFKFAPDGALRYTIYNNGNWLAKKREVDENSVVDNIAPFYAFTNIGNTNSQKPTFKFMHVNFTHFPYGISAEGGKCNFLKKGTVLKKPEIFEPQNKKDGFEAANLKDLSSKGFREQHFDTEACALFLLSNYLKWLKVENIYDNTQIFILSDHAGTDSFNKIPALSPRIIGHDILFLFKDFNQKGELKTDNRLMANFDAAPIFCENIPNGCPNISKNILKNYPQNRAIIHTRPSSIGQTNSSRDEWLIERAYKIHGALDNPKSYTDMSAEYATVGEFAKKK